MNVLLINNQANPELSGIASHFKYIEKELLSSKYTVFRLVASNTASNQAEPNVKYFFFGYEQQTDNEEPAISSRVLKNQESFKKALKEIPWSHVDLVIIANDIYVPSLIEHVSRDKILVIIPSSLKFSELSNPDNFRSVQNRIQKNLRGMKVVVLSEHMRKMLSQFLHETQSLSVVPPGVDTSRFSPPQEHPLNNRILYIGRLAQEKNVSALLHAATKLRSPYIIDIVGDGPFMKALQQTDQKLNVHAIFHGRKKDVEQFYKTARLFVLPSKYESFGLVLLEAMACGLPVVAFRPSENILTASDEIIDDSTNGFLVDNIGDMSKKLDILLKDDSLWKTFSENAICKARSFSWQHHVQTLMETLLT